MEEIESYWEDIRPRRVEPAPSSNTRMSWDKPPKYKWNWWDSSREAILGSNQVELNTHWSVKM